MVVLVSRRFMYEQFSNFSTLCSSKKFPNKTIFNTLTIWILLIYSAVISFPSGIARTFPIKTNGVWIGFPIHNHLWMDWMSRSLSSSWIYLFYVPTPIQCCLSGREDFVCVYSLAVTASTAAAADSAATLEWSSKVTHSQVRGWVVAVTRGRGASGKSELEYYENCLCSA